MTTIDTEVLIRAYLEDLLSGAEINDATNWAWEAMTFLIFNEPEMAWPIIVEIVRRSLDPMQLVCMGTGALETLLDTYPEQFVDRVETIAASDEKFRKVLAYSNLSTIDDARLRSRFTSAAGRSEPAVP
jgi:hypothetical protein